MCPKCDECHWGNCRESISVGQKGSENFSTEHVVFPQTFDKSTSMLGCSALRGNGYVYKRRKLHNNSYVLLSAEDSTSSPNRISGCDFPMATTDFRSPIESIPSFASSSNCSIIGHGRENLFAGNLYKYASKCHSRLNGSSALSKPNVGHDSTTVKNAVVNTGECSSYDEVIKELSRMFMSAKELGISAIRSHALLGGDPSTKTCTSSEDLGGNNKLTVSCKICGFSENSIKMLICDLCEEAFHESCCKPKKKVLPDDEWYCKSCLNMKRKTPRREHKGKSLEKIISRRRKSHLESVISLMLMDTLPHTSKVRIGKEFQAVVPDWSGPKYD